MSCTSCGRPLAVDARFCSHCGASQMPTGDERRVVTVVFVDIVGFTTLAEKLDPEVVKHLVDRTFERLIGDITSFGGVVDKVLGDGIIALFGAPIAHEDDAERAVRAGLRMQQTVMALSHDYEPPIRVRIGINTGEVLVGTTPAGGDYTAMGDVMNSADRLQHLAAPGQTLVGGATRLATGDAIAYESAGQLPARGREAPIEAWVALEAVHPPGLHHRRGAVFVGRRNELALLAAQARLAVEGSRAQFGVIFGEAGMGKTRLISEAAAHIESEFGATVLEGRCLPYGEANVWWPVADLVRDLFSLGVDAPVDQTEIRLRKCLAEHLEPPGDADVDRFTTALLHALGYHTVLRGGDRNRNRSEVMLAFTTIVEAELARRPVVIVLSDLHWAAAVIWVLLDHVLTELARQRLVVLTTARPMEEDHLPQGRYGLSVVQLGPLDEVAAASLLSELGLDLAPSRVADLVDRSGGNPFFLEELAGLVTKEGPVVDTAEHDFATNLDDLPATLRGIIAARLDALDSGERGLLEDASVLGRTGTLEGLRILAAEGRGVDDASPFLAGLIEKDLLEIKGVRYRFVSNLVRDVAYGRLTKSTRARRHFGIATFLEQDDEAALRNSQVVAIAEHYRAAAQLSDEVAVVGLDRAQVLSRAIHWLQEAGERALDVGAPKQAVKWFDQGIDLAEDDAALALFLFGRARARNDFRDIAGARSDLERLEALTRRDPVLAAKALLIQGEVDRKAGDLDQAAARLREAADRLSVLEVPDQQSLALRLLGLTEAARCDDSLARRALEGSRSVAIAAGDRRGEAWALQAMASHAFQLGRVLEARHLVDEAIGIFTELDDRGGLVWAQSVQAWVAFHTGAWDEARLLIDTVLPETRRRGDPWAEAIMLILDASLQLWSGHAGTAVELARQARAVAERVSDVTLAVQSRAFEGRALVSLGAIDEGTDSLEQAFSIADQAGDRESRRIALITNCASAARLGEPDRAIRWAARFDGLHDDPTVVGEADLVMSLALALLQRGAVDEAASQLLWAETTENPRAGHFANAVGSLVAAAQGDQELALRLVALTLTEGSTYLDRVYALLAQAAVCVAAGDIDGGDQALAAARAELAATDDQVSRLLVDLAASLYLRSSSAEAEQRMRSAGMDPAGWVMALRRAAGATASVR
ncbi:MAG: adenylate/guanylate cyclase domain-containing protein [Acidimicrobiales bacterium]